MEYSVIRTKIEDSIEFSESRYNAQPVAVKLLCQLIAEKLNMPQTTRKVLHVLSVSNVSIRTLSELVICFLPDEKALTFDEWLEYARNSMYFDDVVTQAIRAVKAKIWYDQRMDFDRRYVEYLKTRSKLHTATYPVARPVVRGSTEFGKFLGCEMTKSAAKNESLLFAIGRAMTWAIKAYPQSLDQIGAFAMKLVEKLAAKDDVAKQLLSQTRGARVMIDELVEVKVDPYHIALYHPTVSTEEKGQIAYTPSVEYLARSRRARSTPGRFFTRYCRLDEKTAKSLAESFFEKYVAYELKISDKSEDFVRVINFGPSESCQSSSYHADNEDWYLGHAHPAVCYASGDIEICWIENSKGEVVARMLLNKYTRKATRIYGDVPRMEASIRLHNELKNDRIVRKSGALVGCKLLRIENRLSRGYLMPYVDAGTGSGGGSLYAKKYDDEYWILNDNDEGIDTYCGYDNKGVAAGDKHVCDRCGEGVSEADDLTHVRCGSSVCNSCLEDHYVYCDDVSDYCLNDQTYECQTTGNHYYRESSVWECPECGDYHHVSIEPNLLGDGRRVCDNCYESSVSVVNSDHNVMPDAVDYWHGQAVAPNIGVYCTVTEQEIESEDDCFWDEGRGGFVLINRDSVDETALSDDQATLTQNIGNVAIAA